MSLRHDSPKETLCERQSPYHPKTTFAGQLVCPHCHDNSLAVASPLENRNRGHSMSKVFFPLRRLSHRKWLLYGLIAVLLALLFTGCVFNLGGSGVRGSGIIKTESRSVSGFSSIAFNSEGKVTVQQTGKESLTINAEDNLLPLLESRVTNGILSLAKPTGGNRHGE